jgi:uncharacterized RDD family membrane protein YckC
MIACSKCGTSNEDHAVYCQKCGQALTGSATAPVSSGAVTTGENYGGFWIRVLATLIDAIVVSAATGLIISITFGIGWFVVFVSQWLYEAFMTSSSWQATLGKRVFNMVVTDAQGQRITFARATGRHFAKWLSTMVLGIGFLMVAFTRKKQGLHDMLADTYVVIR